MTWSGEGSTDAGPHIYVYVFKQPISYMLNKYILAWLYIIDYVRYITYRKERKEEEHRYAIHMIIWRVPLPVGCHAA